MPEVLDTSALQLGPLAPRGMRGLAVGPDDEIVLGYQSMADANGIFVNGKLVLGPPDITGTGSSVWAASLAVNGSGDIFFVGRYQGQQGVFEIDHSSILPSSNGSPVVTQVLSDQYDSIAVWYERSPDTPPPPGPTLPLGPMLPQGPTLPSGDFLVGSTVTLSEGTSPDAPDAPPQYQPGSLWVNETQLFSLPWTGPRRPDAFLPQSFNDVATNGAGDIFFSGQYQGQVGTFKIDPTHYVASQVSAVPYDFIAIGPGDSLIGTILHFTQTDHSGTIYRDGKEVLTEDVYLGQVAVNASGDIFFDGIQNDRRGVYKIDHASSEVTRVQDGVYNYFALGPGDEIVGSSPNQIGATTTFITVNGSTVLIRPTGGGGFYDSFDAVAVDGAGNIFFSGIYQSSPGVFELQPDPQTGSYRVSKVTGSTYNELTVGFNSVVTSGEDPASGPSDMLSADPPPAAADERQLPAMSPQLDLLGQDPSSWVKQYGAGKSPAQAAHDYWESAKRWGRAVDGYYRAFLGRDAEAIGRAYWVGRFAAGADEAAVIRGFLTSEEFTQTHATDRVFVESLYQDVLLRTADAPGEQYWLGRLAAGAGRAEIVQEFLQSTEAVRQAVAGLYAVYLNRQGEAAGISFWAQAIQSGRETLGQVAQSFLASDEFYADALKGTS